MTRKEQQIAKIRQRITRLDKQLDAQYKKYGEVHAAVLELVSEQRTMKIKAPFQIKKVCWNKNGLHCRLLSTWGSTIREFGAFVLGPAIPQAWYWYW